MYGSQATQKQIESEQNSGYNIFGGKSLFDNENSARSRTRYVQEILNNLTKGKGWQGFSAADIFGSKVQPALFQNEEYTPIDYGEVQGQTIEDNQRNLPASIALSDAINSALRDDSDSRISRWSPEFTDNLRSMSSSAKSLLGGRLPYEDVLDIVSNRQQLGNTLGTAGTFTGATLKDLGISRLQAMQTGSEMMSRIGNLVESIDPIGQRSRPQDWTLEPKQTVPLKQQDNQFGATFGQMERILAQQSEQNANVLNAAADPAGRGLFGAEFALKTGTPIGGAGAGGGMDWGGLIGGLFKAYQGYQAGQNGAGGGYASQAQSQRYNPDSYGNWGYDDGSTGMNNFAAQGDYGQ